MTSIDNVSIHYDDKGNLIQDNNGQTYVWDIDNHMKSSTVSGVVTQYEYDALGRRLSKSTSGSKTVYVSSGAQVVSEYDGAGNHERSYVYGSYVDKPIVMIDGATGTKSYYHCNYQYSVMGLTDESGAVIELYAYTPYGERAVFDAAGEEKAGSDSDNPYGFTGRRLDSETGLWYFRARYYDDGLGRFISRDPLGYVDGMSLYRGYFVPNGVDPSGEHIEDPAMWDPEDPNYIGNGTNPITWLIETFGESKEEKKMRENRERFERDMLELRQKLDRQKEEKRVNERLSDLPSDVFIGTYTKYGQCIKDCEIKAANMKRDREFMGTSRATTTPSAIVRLMQLCINNCGTKVYPKKSNDEIACDQNGFSVSCTPGDVQKFNVRTIRCKTRYGDTIGLLFYEYTCKQIGKGTRWEKRIATTCSDNAYSPSKNPEIGIKRPRGAWPSAWPLNKEGKPSENFVNAR